MGFWSVVKNVLAVGTSAPAPTSTSPAPSESTTPSAVDRKAIAAEIVAAEKSSGRSHWDVGVEIAERHGLSVFDVHDEYMKESDRLDRREEALANPVKAESVDPTSLSVLDLREIPSVRMRIKGSANWVTDKQREKFGGTEYLLVREPKNRHDESAIAVHGKGRKVGYVSAAKAAALAPLLDPLPFDAFLVGGMSVIENSIRLWVDIPKVVELRQFLKARDVAPRSSLTDGQPGEIPSDHA
jgi:hypothetical protein